MKDIDGGSKNRLRVESNSFKRIPLTVQGISISIEEHGIVFFDMHRSPDHTKVDSNQ